MILLFFTALLATRTAAFQISIYADVHKDVEFFTRTFPWIIDNIGGDLVFDYSLVGSGRYSIPQMCALGDLKWNPFLQAQYLKCEAEGKPGGYCLCEAGIDPQTFQRCVASGGYLAGSASNKFSQLGINFTPIIELEPNNTVYGVEDIAFLEKICTVFGNHLPRGCVHYTNRTERFTDKKALAQFDRACHKEFPISGDDDKPVSPEPAPTPETTTRGTTTTQGTTTPVPGWWTTTTTQGTTTPVPSWPTTTTTPGTTTSQVPGCSTSPTTLGTTTSQVPGCSTNPSTQSTTTPMPDWWTTTQPPWWTTAPTWWTTSPWVTQTTTEGTTALPQVGSTISTPDWWWTTPLPWLSTTSPPWTSASTWVTQPPPWWLKIASQSLKPQPELQKPYMQNEENTEVYPNISGEPETPKVPLE